MFPNWYYNPQGSVNLQGGSPQLQGGGSSAGQSLQGSSPTLQVSSGTGQRLQPAISPNNVSSAGSQGQVLGATTQVSAGADPAAQAAAAAAAANAAKAAALRGQITNIANTIKDIFNSRYGQVDQSAAEQTGVLNNRFATESGDITQQVEGENQKLGAAHAAGGSFDSSYRGNNVDTVTKAGDAQIRDLGTELNENLSKIGGWVSSQKAGFDSQKGGIDSVLAHLAESTDPGELTQIRNSLEGRIAELRAGNADNNTMAQNKGALEAIAPSAQRAQKLATTLSQIVGGNADPTQKSAIAARLIQSAGLTPQEQEALMTSFQGDLKKQQVPA